MNDHDFDQMLRQARHAQARVDLSGPAGGFETRLSSQLAGLAHGRPGGVLLLWRSVAGCAALVGLLAVWFILAQTPLAAEDDLTAFWDGGQASYDDEWLH